MENIIFRIFKSIVLAFVMFFSIRYLGFSTRTAVMFALLPLILGVTNVMIGLAYSLTALFLVLAVFSSMFLPTFCDNAAKCMVDIFTDTGIMDLIKHAN